MQKEEIHFQPLHQVLSNAHLRRSADLGAWLKQLFESRRQVRLQKMSKVSTSALTVHQPSA